MLREAQGVPLDLEAVRRALADVWPDVEVHRAELLTGGLSSVLHRVTLAGAPQEHVVVRQLLEEFGGDATTVRREAAVHGALPGFGLPVPAVVLSDPDGTVLGRPTLVLEHVPGTLLLADLATAAARAGFATTIAQIAAVPPRGMLADLDVLGDVDAHLHRFGAPPQSDIVDADRLQAAIDDARPWFLPRRQVVHTDLHAGNVLWDGVRVTGVLDWAGAALGNALFDEAYAWLDTCLAHGRDVADQLQDAVDERRAGPRPAPGEVALWRACALHRALPSPAPWAAVYRAAGLDVTDEQVEARWVELVDEQLDRT